jgi:hypothetical protein
VLVDREGVQGREQREGGEAEEEHDSARGAGAREVRRDAFQEGVHAGCVSCGCRCCGF